MRVKVACINWSHPDAPHAMTYVLHEERGLICETYHDTWAQAMARASYLTGLIGRSAS